MGRRLQREKGAAEIVLAMLKGDANLSTSLEVGQEQFYPVSRRSGQKALDLQISHFVGTPSL